MAFTNSRRQSLEPFAQSFLVSEVGGLYVTSLELYFQTKDSIAPVIVDIRKVEDNAPSLSHLPFSRVSVPATDIAVSDDASEATSITFESPVYLEENAKYCFTIRTTSDVYRLWFSQLGQIDNENSAVVIDQVNVHSLYRSSDNAWIEDQTNNIKFTLNRARFSTSNGVFVFNDSPTNQRDLGADPFQTIAGSDIVRVNHINHGYFPATNTGAIRSRTSIGHDDTTVATFNGIPIAELTGEHDVLDASADHYTIRVTTKAAKSGKTGGSIWRAATNTTINQYRPTIDTVLHPSTSLQWSAKLMNGRSLTDESSINQIETVYSAIPADKTIMTSSPKVILSAASKALGNDVNDRSAYIRAQGASGKNNVSPVFDIDRASLIAVSNRLNNPAPVVLARLQSINTDGSFTVDDASSIEPGMIIRGPELPDDTVVSVVTTGSNEVVASEAFTGTVTTNTLYFFTPADSGNDYYVGYRDGTASENSAALSKYITKKVELAEAAETVNVIFLANKPTDTYIDVFVKVRTPDNADTDFDDLDWVEVVLPEDFPTSDNVTDWQRVEFVYDNPQLFSAFAVKIELRSKNTSRIPKFKDFKAIALT